MIYAGFLFLDVKLSLVFDIQVSPEIVNTTVLGLSDYTEGCCALFPLSINWLFISKVVMCQLLGKQRLLWDLNPQSSDSKSRRLIH